MLPFNNVNKCLIVSIFLIIDLPFPVLITTVNCGMSSVKRVINNYSTPLQSYVRIQVYSGSLTKHLPDQ